MQYFWPTNPNIVGCYVLRPFAHPVACWWMLLRVVAQSSKPVKLFSQQLPTFLLLRDCQSIAQQCWIRLHSSSNIVGVTHAHYAWFTRLMGCILPMMHCRSQHYWELLHPFTHHRQHERNNSQCCWRNNVGSCCVCLPTALVTSVKWYWYPCSGRFCAPNRLNESPDLLWISLQPPWQIDNGMLNRPITARTQIQVNRWGPRTRISALLHRPTKIINE